MSKARDMALMMDPEGEIGSTPPWLQQGKSIDTRVFCEELYDVYKLWCEDNAYNPLSSRSFSNYLAQHADDYNLEATNNIRIGSGKRCRGYLGIEILNRPYVG